jgi:NAD(P)-dependent dehydrogenase (short-subunit alcohol dehydrogenase family)
MNRLKGKRALITGGTSGIGLETAKQFLAEGARVAVTGSNSKTLEAASAELGKDVIMIQADAGNVADQKKTAEEVRKAFGGLDILFVNAGVGDFRPLDAWDEAGFDRSFAINVKGPFFLIQALLPILANPASIVLNTSVNAHIGMPMSAIYAASKAALSSFIRTFSGELIGRGIRVNAVSPGPIATLLHGKIGMDDEAIKGLISQIPAKRRGDPSEIAKAVIFLASDEAAFTIGSELTIDGGMTTL